MVAIHRLSLSWWTARTNILGEQLSNARVLNSEQRLNDLKIANEAAAIVAAEQIKKQQTKREGFAKEKPILVIAYKCDITDKHPYSKYWTKDRDSGLKISELIARKELG